MPAFWRSTKTSTKVVGLSTSDKRCSSSASSFASSSPSSASSSSSAFECEVGEATKPTAATRSDPSACPWLREFLSQSCRVLDVCFLVSSRCMWLRKQPQDTSVRPHYPQPACQTTVATNCPTCHYASWDCAFVAGCCGCHLPPQLLQLPVPLASLPLCLWII